MSLSDWFQRCRNWISMPSTSGSTPTYAHDETELSDTEMSILLELPAELWGVINCFLDFGTIQNMKVLNRSSRAFLARRGVITRIHLVSRPKLGPVLTEWPGSVFEKHRDLNSIGIQIFAQSSRCPMTETQVLALPRHLKHLYLGFVDTIKDSYLSSLPLHLETLHMDQNMLISDNGIALLPRKLKSLSLAGNYALTPRCFSDLPEGLTSLSIRANTPIYPAHLANLPQTLTCLNLYSGHLLGDPCISTLPRGLKMLEWNVKAPLDEKQMLQLPRGLVTLQFSLNGEVCALKEIPPSVRRLVIQGISSIASTCIEALPIGITDLELVVKQDLSADVIGKLPRNLERLSLPNAEDWTYQHLLALPPNLRVLSIPKVEIENTTFESLPTRLESLAIRFTPTLNETCFRYVPLTLRRLEIKACTEITSRHSVQSAFCNAPKRRDPKADYPSSRYETHVFHLVPQHQRVQYEREGIRSMEPQIDFALLKVS